MRLDVRDEPAGSVIPIPGQGAGLAPLPDNYLRYVGYPIGRPHSSLAHFQFTVKEFHRLTPEGVKGNAMSLDLREFRRSGGKLILWHGWDDQSIPAVGTLDYYQSTGSAPTCATFPDRSPRAADRPGRQSKSKIELWS